MKLSPHIVAVVHFATAVTAFAGLDNPISWNIVLMRRAGEMQALHLLIDDWKKRGSPHSKIAGHTGNPIDEIQQIREERLADFKRNPVLIGLNCLSFKCQFSW